MNMLLQHGAIRALEIGIIINLYQSSVTTSRMIYFILQADTGTCVKPVLNIQVVFVNSVCEQCSRIVFENTFVFNTETFVRELPKSMKVAAVVVLATRRVQ